mmetsp:Transcript_26253/g.37370  ORF Transcript_26253/g.37370 Transcript_26253/m.37370 type:complete len:308 (-) Transcript_26253:4362-5285(-)
MNRLSVLPFLKERPNRSRIAWTAFPTSLFCPAEWNLSNSPWVNGAETLWAEMSPTAVPGSITFCCSLRCTNPRAARNCPSFWTPTSCRSLRTARFSKKHSRSSSVTIMWQPWVSSRHRSRTWRYTVCAGTEADRALPESGTPFAAAECSRTTPTRSPNCNGTAVLRKMRFWVRTRLLVNSSSRTSRSNHSRSSCRHATSAPVRSSVEVSGGPSRCQISSSVSSSVVIGTSSSWSVENPQLRSTIFFWALRTLKSWQTDRSLRCSDVLRSRYPVSAVMTAWAMMPTLEDARWKLCSTPLMPEVKESRT